MSASAVLDRLEKNLNAKIDSIRSYRGWVVNTVNGMVRIRRVAQSGDPTSEAYSRLGPPVKLAADDEVAVIVLGDKAFILGPIQRAVPTQVEFDVPLVGQMYRFGSTASGSDTSSTAVVSPASVTAITRTLNNSDMPPGTYNILVEGDHLTAHSTGGSLSTGTQCAGVDGTFYTLSAASGTAAQRNVAASTFTNVVMTVGGSIACSLAYRSSTAGTSSSRNPHISITATRVGD